MSKPSIQPGAALQFINGAWREFFTGGHTDFRGRKMQYTGIQTIHGRRYHVWHGIGMKLVAQEV